MYIKITPRSRPNYIHVLSPNSETSINMYIIINQSFNTFNQSIP